MFIIKTTGVSNSINKRKKPDCDRTIIADSTTLPLREAIDHKFCEIVTFRNSASNKYAICIGLNPKWGREKQFDRSNQKIADYLNRNNYGGYILLNMFSIIAKDIKALRNYIQQSSCNKCNDMRNIIALILKRVKNDIYLFYGDKAFNFVQKKLSSSLKKIYKNGGKIYISLDSNGKFVHVGSQKCCSRTQAHFVVYNKNFSNVF